MPKQPGLTHPGSSADLRPAQLGAWARTGQGLKEVCMGEGRVAYSLLFASSQSSSITRIVSGPSSLPLPFISRST